MARMTNNNDSNRTIQTSADSVNCVSTKEYRRLKRRDRKVFGIDDFMCRRRSGATRASLGGVRHLQRRAETMNKAKTLWSKYE